MNLKGDEQIKSLGVLAKENNLTVVLLKKLINSNRLKFEKKAGNFYSSQAWIEEYKRNFTFSGFMLNRVYGEGKQVEEKLEKPLVQKNTSKKKTGKIVKDEKGIDIDIEKAFVQKWNNEFREINNQLDDYIKNTSKKKRKNTVNDLVKNPHNIHSATIAIAIIFLLAFYSVTMMPGSANAFTKKIDDIIKVPYEYANSLAIKVVNDDDQFIGAEPSSQELADYIKNKTSNISYPNGTTINVEKKDILGRVAGVSEEYTGDLSTIEKIKKASMDVLVKISDKQKRASLKLNDKLNKFISSIVD